MNQNSRYLEQAEAHRRAGRAKRAQAIYRQVLRQDPGCAAAILALATSLFDEGDRDGAAEQFRRLTRARPQLAEGHFNLGTVLAALGRTDEAIDAFARAVVLAPALADAHLNLGVALAARGDLAQALGAYEQAIQHAPEMLAARVNQATTLIKLRRFDEAIAQARRAVEQHPTAAQAHYTLALALDFAGRGDEAAASFQEAVRLNPGASEWRFHLAARGGESPQAPPADYVASLFDSYAERFDEHLVGELGYRGPEQLLAAVTAAAPKKKLDIMDLGCGTGLCGALFRPLAKTLAGCDLSPQMVKAAKSRGCYDDVRVGDIRAALAGRAGQFDLILAGDVFVYVGDLAEIFPLAFTALRAGGLFAFTVEAHEGSGYALRPTRRYAHNLEYLRGLAAENGFVEQSAESVVLRKDHNAEVMGWVVVWRR